MIRHNQPKFEDGMWYVYQLSTWIFRGTIDPLYNKMLIEIFGDEISAGEWWFDGDVFEDGKVTPYIYNRNGGDHSEMVADYIIEMYNNKINCT